MDIKKIVNSLVKKHKTRNPFEIVKGMNVILVPVPLEGVRGFYQYFQRNNIIYIDDSLPEHEQILVCAHELGHMLLHKKLTLYSWILIPDSIQQSMKWKPIYSLWNFWFRMKYFRVPGIYYGSNCTCTWI